MSLDLENIFYTLSSRLFTRYPPPRSGGGYPWPRPRTTSSGAGSREKSGSNNPMFNKKHKSETLNKLRNKIYVYNINMHLLKEYVSITQAIKDLYIGYQTLKKYCDSGIICKDKLFSSIPLTV